MLLSVLAPGFFSLGNQLNILRQAAPILVVAIGMTLVITIGGIDLSVGSGLGLAAVLSATMLEAGWNPWVAVLTISTLGLLAGGINGYFIAFQRIPAFIVTLASLSVLRGAAQLITKGYSIPIGPESPFIAIGR
ncbi:MAG: ABC transporter permease, partial [Acidobacteriota bacterium]|nr:ABC transporter permease [Acidobacteriota bacterium]